MPLSALSLTKGHNLPLIAAMDTSNVSQLVGKNGFTQEARDAREARLRKTKEERDALRAIHGRDYAKKARRANMEKAHAAMRLKKKQRDIVREKVAAGMPITEQEQQLLSSRLNVKNKSRQAQEEATLAAASKLLIQPQNVKELRILVDRIAHKHAYNPLEQLIKMTLPTENPDGTYSYQIPAADRATIHKALLPYLTPQLKVSPVKEEDPKNEGVKVVISQFVFPEDKKDSGKIFDKFTASVVTTEQPPAALTP